MVDTRGVHAADLTAGAVIVQQLRVGVVLREVLDVGRVVKGGAEWIHVEARQDGSPLRLDYPPGSEVRVVHTGPGPAGPLLSWDGPRGVIRVRAGSAVLAHLAEQQTLAVKGPWLYGTMLCGRWVNGRRVPAHVDAEVCKPCTDAADGDPPPQTPRRMVWVRTDRGMTHLADTRSVLVDERDSSVQGQMVCGVSITGQIRTPAGSEPICSRCRKLAATWS